MTAVLAVTGHRPFQIANGLGKMRLEHDDANALLRFARRQIEIISPERLVCGMALGWDHACAVACVQLGLPFTAYLAFEGQERSWNSADQRLHRDLLERAESVRVVCDYKLDIAYQHRNEAMVDASNALLALWHGGGSGTRNCIAYAERWGVMVTNCWSEWEKRYAASDAP